MVGELQETEGGAGETLRLAEGEFDRQFNRLFGLHPTLNEPYHEVSRGLIHGLIKAQLEATETAKVQMSAGEKIAPRFQQALARCERALETLEGRRNNPTSLRELTGLWVDTAKEDADIGYGMMMANRPPKLFFWQKDKRIRKGQEAGRRKRTLYDRSEEVRKFIVDNVDEWMSGGEWSPASSE